MSALNPSTEEITVMLRAWTRTRAVTCSTLFCRWFMKNCIDRRTLRGERRSHTLQTTALINIEPEYDTLRDDTRFSNLPRRINLSAGL